MFPARTSPTICCTSAAAIRRCGCSTACRSSTRPSPPTSVPSSTQGHRLSRSEPRQLRRRVWRPHLRRLQRRATHRLRTEQRRRAERYSGQLPSDQRRLQHRRPHGAIRLLHQRQCQPQRPRSPDTRAPGRARRRERVRRLHVPDLQCGSFQPAAAHHDGAEGHVSDPQRSRSQRHREWRDRRERRQPAMAQHRPERHAARSRCRRSPVVGAHLQPERRDDDLALLPLQQRQLQQLARRRARRRHGESRIQLRGRAGQRVGAYRQKQPSGRRLQLLSE